MRIIAVLKQYKVGAAIIALLVVAALVFMTARSCGERTGPAAPVSSSRTSTTATSVRTQAASATLVRTATPTPTATPTFTPTWTPTLTSTPTPTETRMPVPITAANADRLYTVDQLPASAPNVQSVSLSRDTRSYAYGLSDGTLQLWKVATTAPVLSLKIPGNMDPKKSYAVMSAALSPDGASMAGGYADNKMRLWRFAELSAVVEGGHGGAVWTVAYSRDGKLIASGSEDKNVQIRQATDGGRANAMGGHSAPVRSLAFSPDGSLLASGSDDRSVILWRTADRKLQRRLPGHPDPVTAVAFAPNGQILATGADTVRLWQVTNSGLPQVLERPANLKGSIKGLAYSPNGEVLAGFATNNHIALWSVGDGRIIADLNCQVCGTGPIMAVAFAEDGLTMAVASANQIVWYAVQ